MARIIFVATVLVALCYISQAQWSVSEEVLQPISANKLREKHEILKGLKNTINQLPISPETRRENLLEIYKKLEEIWNNHIKNKEPQVAGLMDDIRNEIQTKANDAKEQIEDIKNMTKEKKEEISKEIGQEIAEDTKTEGYLKDKIEKDMMKHINEVIEKLEPQIKKQLKEALEKLTKLFY